MFAWLRRLFRRKDAALEVAEPTPKPSEIAVVPFSEDSIRTEIVNRHHERMYATSDSQQAKAMSQLNPDLSLSQAQAVLASAESGPRAEIVVMPDDGMAVPVLDRKSVV